LLISVTGISGQSMFRKILDFDGDGRADFAVVHQENNLKVWYIWQSTAGFRAMQWGFATDSMVPGDYDGDGKTDVAVYRIQHSSNARHDFYILQSQDNSFAAKSLTTPSPGFVYYVRQQDYDGDGKTDQAVYRRGSPNGVYYINESLNGFRAFAWANSNDLPVTYESR
jgi:hypothetical protein